MSYSDRRIQPARGSGLIFIVVAIMSLMAGTAEAKQKLQTGFADFSFPGLSQTWMDRTSELGGDIVRINAYWRDIAPQRPAKPTDPRDAAYAWATLDGIIRGAASRGLQPMIAVYNSPQWAQGANRPGNAAYEVWRPNAAAFGDFAQALATRYSGGFDPDEAGPQQPLPEVRYLQAWNEPNLAFYLAPQWSSGQSSPNPPPSAPPPSPPPTVPPLPPILPTAKAAPATQEADPVPRSGAPAPESPALFRSLLNAFYAGAHAGNPDVRVVAAGTAPIGYDPGGEGMRPLAFWREVFCLGEGNQPSGDCPEKARFDVLAHHPISVAGDPTIGANHPDEVFTADLHKLVDLLRAAEKLGTVASGKKHAVWASEFWIESDPPDETSQVSLEMQARWIQQSLYMFWKQGTRVALYFQAADAPFDRANPKKNLQSGVYFEDWRPKPSADGFRFPFVTANRSRSKVTAWGVAARKGKVRIQERANGGWKTLDQIRGVKPDEVFDKRVRPHGAGKLRATQGSIRSLTWPGAG